MDSASRINLQPVMDRSWRCSFCSNRSNTPGAKHCKRCEARRTQDRFGVRLRDQYFLCRVDTNLMCMSFITVGSAYLKAISHTSCERVPLCEDGESLHDRVVSTLQTHLQSLLVRQPPIQFRIKQTVDKKPTKQTLQQSQPGSLFDKIVDQSSQQSYDTTFGHFVGPDDPHLHQAQRLKHNLVYPQQMRQEQITLGKTVKEAKKRAQLKHIDDLTVQELRKQNKREKWVPCALCEKEFPLLQLLGCITFKGVVNWRREHDVSLDATDHRVASHSIHNAARLCVFCSQFFDIPYVNPVVHPLAAKEFEGVGLSELDALIDTNHPTQLHKTTFQGFADQHSLQRQQDKIAHFQHKVQVDVLKAKKQLILPVNPVDAPPQNKRLDTGSDAAAGLTGSTTNTLGDNFLRSKYASDLPEVATHLAHKPIRVSSKTRRSKNSEKTPEVSPRPAPESPIEATPPKHALLRVPSHIIAPSLLTRLNRLPSCESRDEFDNEVADALSIRALVQSEFSPDQLQQLKLPSTLKHSPKAHSGTTPKAGLQQLHKLTHGHSPPKFPLPTKTSPTQSTSSSPPPPIFKETKALKSSPAVMVSNAISRSNLATTLQKRDVIRENVPQEVLEKFEERQANQDHWLVMMSRQPMRDEDGNKHDLIESKVAFRAAMQANSAAPVRIAEPLPDDLSGKYKFSTLSNAAKVITKMRHRDKPNMIYLDNSLFEDGQPPQFAAPPIGTKKNTQSVEKPPSTLFDTTPTNTLPTAAATVAVNETVSNVGSTDEQQPHTHRSEHEQKGLFHAIIALGEKLHAQHEKEAPIDEYEQLNARLDAIDQRFAQDTIIPRKVQYTKFNSSKTNQSVTEKAKPPTQVIARVRSNSMSNLPSASTLRKVPPKLGRTTSASTSSLYKDPGVQKQLRKKAEIDRKSNASQLVREKACSGTGSSIKREKGIKKRRKSKRKSSRDLSNSLSMEYASGSIEFCKSADILDNSNSQKLSVDVAAVGGASGGSSSAASTGISVKRAPQPLLLRLPGKTATGVHVVEYNQLSQSPGGDAFVKLLRNSKDSNSKESSSNKNSSSYVTGNNDSPSKTGNRMVSVNASTSPVTSSTIRKAPTTGLQTNNNNNNNNNFYNDSIITNNTLNTIASSARYDQQNSVATKNAEPPVAKTTAQNVLATPAENDAAATDEVYDEMYDDILADREEKGETSTLVDFFGEQQQLPGDGKHTAHNKPGTGSNSELFCNSASSDMVGKSSSCSKSGSRKKRKKKARVSKTRPSSKPKPGIGSYSKSVSTSRDTVLTGGSNNNSARRVSSAQDPSMLKKSLQVSNRKSRPSSQQTSVLGSYSQSKSCSRDSVLSTVSNTGSGKGKFVKSTGTKKSNVATDSKPDKVKKAVKKSSVKRTKSAEKSASASNLSLTQKMHEMFGDDTNFAEFEQRHADKQTGAESDVSDFEIVCESPQQKRDTFIDGLLDQAQRDGSAGSINRSKSYGLSSGSSIPEEKNCSGYALSTKSSDLRLSTDVVDDAVAVTEGEAESSPSTNNSNRFFVSTESEKRENAAPIEKLTILSRGSGSRLGSRHSHLHSRGRGVGVVVVDRGVVGGKHELNRSWEHNAVS